jgi:hypothetical protein
MEYVFVAAQSLAVHSFRSGSSPTSFPFFFQPLEFPFPLMRRSES